MMAGPKARWIPGVRKERIKGKKERRKKKKANERNGNWTRTVIVVLVKEDSLEWRW